MPLCQHGWSPNFAGVRPTEDKNGPTPVTVGGEGIGTSVALVIMLGVR